MTSKAAGRWDVAPTAGPSRRTRSAAEPRAPASSRFLRNRSEGRSRLQAPSGKPSSSTTKKTPRPAPISPFVTPRTLSGKDSIGPLGPAAESFGPHLKIRTGIQELAIEQIKNSRKAALSRSPVKSNAKEPPIKPTHIQSLAIQHFILTDPSEKQRVDRSTKDEETGFMRPREPGSQTVLGAETGSGKTWAYLFPLLHRLKETERSKETETGQSSKLHPALPFARPRAVILAPTHELARQLARSAKSLSHIDKLRVLCLSSGGWVEELQRDIRTIQAANASIPVHEEGQESGMLSTESGNVEARPLDILVATPHRLLDVCKSAEERASEAHLDKEKDGRRNTASGADDKAQLVSLDAVETVVIDEADVLLSPDFASATRAILHRAGEKGGEPARDGESELESPVDLILATASISASLSTYLEKHHPNVVYLLSKGLHKLPKTLETKYVDPGSSRHHALAKEVKEALTFEASGKNKILIFVEKKKTVELLSTFFKAQGIENIALTGESRSRSMRTNSHLAGFLSDARAEQPTSEEQTQGPRVLVSTSLLSRGLDFNSSISHIFIPDAGSASAAAAGSYARRVGGGSTNLTALELLHRAGRAARAGRSARLVLFDKDATADKRRVLKNKQGRVVGRVVGRVEKLVKPLTARA